MVPIVWDDVASLENYLSKQKPSKKSKRETAAERETNKKRNFRSPEDIEAEREATRQKYSQMETEKAAKDVVAKYNEAKKAFAAYALAEETYWRLTDSHTSLGSQSLVRLPWATTQLIRTTSRSF